MEEFEKAMKPEVDLSRKHIVEEINLEQYLGFYLIGVMSTYNTFRRLLYEIFPELKQKRLERETESY